MTVNPERVTYNRGRLGVASAGLANLFYGYVLRPSDPNPAAFGHVLYGQAHFLPGEDVQLVHYSDINAALNGFSGVALIEDATDPSGDFTTATGSDTPNTAAGVVLWAYFGSDPGATPNVFRRSATLQLPTKPGTYRCIPSQGDSAGNCRRASAVNTGVGSTEWHLDTDFNSASGGAPLFQYTGGTNGQLHAGRIVVMAPSATVFAVGAPDNLHYGETIQARLDLNATPVNPKPVELVFDNGAEVNEHEATVNASGVATGATKNIDTEFSLTPDDYTVIARIPEDVDTPAHLRPDIFAQADNPAEENPNLDDTQRGWISFGTVSGTPRHRLADAGTTTIGSGISIDTVESYTDAGRATVSNGFTRTVGTSTPNDSPFLRATILDAYGNPLPSTNVTMAVLDSDGTSENNQATLTTDGSGVVDWTYTIATSHKAFNRFKRTSPDDPDSLGAHDGLFSAHSPAGTKTGDYPDPKLPNTTRTFGSITATGGIESTPGDGYKYHTFNSSGTFEITAGSGLCEYLIVAGGGGGGASGNGLGTGGGGGGGGLIDSSDTLGVDTYTVTVGAGGAGASGTNNGANGSDSSFNTETADGGGGGAQHGATDGLAGGSGGGAGNYQSGSGGSGGGSTAGQGNDGGSVASGDRGGGGGGAGGAGANGTSGGTGGAGIDWKSLGTYYAGGGGGANTGSGSGPAGGLGGGGAGGADNANTPGVDGTANTGGGGGGDSQNGGASAGDGGSGIVIVRYAV